MTHALIDADVLAYQASVLGERPIDWGDGLWTLHSYENEVRDTFEAQLAGLLAAVKADSYTLAFTDKVNFRQSVLPTYKNNRVAKRRPMLLSWVRQHALENHPCDIRPGLEGDDVLGILATNGQFEDPIICSIDKDFKTIPCRFWDFGRGLEYNTTVADADWWHMYQTLTGDTTDGYKGCPGCGDVGARKVLALPGDMWTNVVAAYTKAKLGEGAALIQAQVARICRAEDFNADTKEVILWTPPSKLTT